MADIVKKETRRVESPDFFERVFDDWARLMPFRRPWVFGRELMGEDVIRVDEFRDGEEFVIRAELPGIDPDKDVELTVADGTLHIQAERREEERREGKGYRRRELRYGSFSRSLPLPPGVKESDIAATYKDGILEIRIPAPKESTNAGADFKEVGGRKDNTSGSGVAARSAVRMGAPEPVMPPATQ